eukprot:CAMPEP_0117026228 /NCGR_PEP_ID=MMETSP0472-20121206/19309_1 /TAXON_ID=693140 ORGANISM="Tiarina fusus, Strain LIS" /NCGR_SAMPLE_ID=MMETSP0472 /ASSEMBLY_ACC=CAM_ASM_000603 /LENGTH=273 /DNA_ID=CAMNT_0004733189 /DNA_START=9 /DNA_END=830 /DNA_ORIENTATION=+
MKHLASALLLSMLVAGLSLRQANPFASEEDLIEEVEDHVQHAEHEERLWHSSVQPLENSFDAELEEAQDTDDDQDAESDEADEESDEEDQNDDEDDEDEDDKPYVNKNWPFTPERRWQKASDPDPRKDPLHDPEALDGERKIPRLNVSPPDNFSDKALNRKKKKPEPPKENPGGVMTAHIPKSLRGRGNGAADGKGGFGNDPNVNHDPDNVKIPKPKDLSKKDDKGGKDGKGKGKGGGGKANSGSKNKEPMGNAPPSPDWTKTKIKAGGIKFE